MDFVEACEVIENRAFEVTIVLFHRLQPEFTGDFMPPETNELLGVVPPPPLKTPSESKLKLLPSDIIVDPVSVLAMFQRNASFQAALRACMTDSRATQISV
jgi:hypothetical protein